MAQQATVQPVTSDLEREANQRGIRSGAGFKASNFQGGQTDPNSGNATPSSDLYIRGGYNPTPAGGSRLSTLASSGAPSAAAAPAPQVSAPAPVAPAPAAPQAQSSGGQNAAMWAMVALQVLGFLFCYVAGTRIRMADGTWKKIEDIGLNDLTALGGRVSFIGKARVAGLWCYKGQAVTGNHVVFEDGLFIRVKDSVYASPLDGEALVYPIATEQHLLVTPTHISADLVETDGGSMQSPSDRMAELNGDAARLAWLDVMEKQHCRTPLPANAA